MPFDRIAFSDKIRRSKEHLAVQDAEIIAETGIAESRLAALMSGSVDPSGDEVLILADFFDCDYKFFISHEKLAAFEETDSLYRKHGEQFSKADRRSVQQFLYLCECESWLWNITNKRTESFDFVPRGSNYKANGAKAALDLRRRLNYEAGQVPSDIFRDFRLLGIHIFRRKLTNSNISGVMIRHPKAGNCVLVNYDEDVYRQRFTAAHELAHAIMEDTTVNLSMGNDGSNLVEVPLQESKCVNEANAPSFCTNIQSITQSDLFEGMGANSLVGRERKERQHHPNPISIPIHMGIRITVEISVSFGLKSRMPTSQAAFVRPLRLSGH